MNAPEAHYVANAVAKIQPFSVTAITLLHFFAKQASKPRPKRLNFQTIRYKGLTSGCFLAIFV